MRARARARVFARANSRVTRAKARGFIPGDIFGVCLHLQNFAYNNVTRIVSGYMPFAIHSYIHFTCALHHCPPALHDARRPQLR